jgi:hypothetical protein
VSGRCRRRLRSSRGRCCRGRQGRAVGQVTEGARNRCRRSIADHGEDRANGKYSCGFVRNGEQASADCYTVRRDLISSDPAAPHDDYPEVAQFGGAKPICYPVGKRALPGMLPLSLLAPGVFFRWAEITVPACYRVINAGGDEHAAVYQSDGRVSVARTVELGRRGSPGAGNRMIKFGARQ